MADPSLGLDLGEERRRCARAGIADYWVLDLNKRRMIVNRSPQAEGYQSVEADAEDETVSPLEGPELRIVVGSSLIFS